MTSTLTPKNLAERRQRLSDAWRRLTRALESESGGRVGRRGRGVLLLAFCAGLALAVGRGESAPGRFGRSPSRATK